MMSSVKVIDDLSNAEMKRLFEAEFGWKLPREWRAFAEWTRENSSFKRQFVGLRPL